MLLRVRVTLPDRPGALGQVARTLGVSGADIVQVVVLERFGGRAVDDFTVVWPGASRVERLMSGLAAIPGVRVDGVWRAIGAPVAGGHDSELLAQVAGNPAEGLATLVDAVPGLLAADWAAAAAVPADWASRAGTTGVSTITPPRQEPASVRPDAVGLTEIEYAGGASLGGLPGLAAGREPGVVCASWRAPDPLRLPEVTPLRPRALEGVDGTRYAVAPFGRAGLVLIVARAEGDGLPAAAFHITEVDRIAQLVRAATAVLGARLDGYRPATPVMR